MRSLYEHENEESWQARESAYPAVELDLYENWLNITDQTLKDVFHQKSSSTSKQISKSCQKFVAWAVLQCVKIFVRRFLGFQNPCSIIQGFGDFLRNFPRILKDILARFSGFWCISVGITRDFDQNFWLKFMGSFRSKKQSPRQNLKQLEVDESRWRFLRWNASENSLAF